MPANPDGSPAVQLQQLKRLRYFNGQVLTAADLRDEQEYLLARLRRRNRFMRGWGIVTGLTVKIDGGTTVVVQPGLAVDCAGNELVVETEARLPVTAECARQYVALRYVEIETDETPVAQGTVEFSRIRESVVVELLDSNPNANHRGMEPGTPGCGQAHPVSLATLCRQGSRWRVVSRMARRTIRR